MSFAFCVSVIIVVQHVGHPVQLRDFHAAKASLAPQILDFYPKIGIAGGRNGISKVIGVLFVFFVKWAVRKKSLFRIYGDSGLYYPVIWGL